MIEVLRSAIEEADHRGALFRAYTPCGYSGDSIIGSLQRFCSLYSVLKNTCYLEIGVYQGLTLLSVANECRDMPCFGIDNFSLDPMYPPTERSRLLFENEHFIQSARIAEMVPEALFFAQSIYNINLFRIFRSFVKLVVHLIKQRRMFRSRFNWSNTYSAALPRAHYNK